MTWVDIGLIVVILLGAGGVGGAVWASKCATPAVRLLGLVVGFRVAPALAAAIYPHAGVEQSIAYVVAFALTAGAIAGIGIALAPRVDALLARSRAGRRLHQWGGFVTGASKSALLLLIFIAAASLVPWQAANRFVSQSPVALWMLRAPLQSIRRLNSLLSTIPTSFVLNER